MNAHRQSLQFVLLAAALGGSAEPAGAQVQLSVAEVREIVDAVLEAELPPERRLSGLSVAQRKIFFDHRETLAAFGHDRPAGAGPSELQLRRPVEEATADILADCGLEQTRCTRLGRNVYVYVVPAPQTYQTESEVVVWVHVLWTVNPPPPESTIRVGFSSEVVVARTSAGSWEYVRTGTVLAY